MTAEQSAFIQWRHVAIADAKPHVLIILQICTSGLRAAHLRWSPNCLAKGVPHLKSTSPHQKRAAVARTADQEQL